MSTEDDFRLANLVTSYGVGTRSYNRSAEKKESDRQRKVATEEYISRPRQEFIVGPICRCRSFALPHELSKHDELRADWDWRIRKE